MSVKHSPKDKKSPSAIASALPAELEAGVLALLEEERRKTSIELDATLKNFGSKLVAELRGPPPPPPSVSTPTSAPPPCDD